MGNPANEKDRLNEVIAQEKAAQEKVPDWQNPELLKDLQAATGIDLKVTRKGERGKRKKNSELADVKKLEDTTRKRLEKKLFKRSRKN